MDDDTHTGSHAPMTCPICDQTLTAADNTDGDLVCTNCDETIHLQLIPTSRLGTSVCPECGGDLEMAKLMAGVLRCADCDCRWTIRTSDWLVPADE